MALPPEVYRFTNGVREENRHLVWDVQKLFSNVIWGILEAFKVYPEIESLPIDTWGVDYVLLKDGEEVFPVHAYRDGRTEAVIPQVHEKVPFVFFVRINKGTVLCNTIIEYSTGHLVESIKRERSI